MNEFVMVSCESGDWEGLYLNGKLVAEGHSVRLEDVLDAIADVFPNKYSYEEISDDFAEEHGWSDNLEGMKEGFV